MHDLLKTFDYEDQPVRVLRLDGEPWLVAADVCRVLDLDNPTRALDRLDDDEKQIVDVNTLTGSEGIPGNPNMNVVSESGFYALVFTSRKPEAKAFRKWVTGTVLPALRKTGSFTDPLHLGAAPERPPLDFMARQDVSNWLSMVREARLLRGPGAAVRMWRASPLPPLDDGQPLATDDISDPVCAFLQACCVITGDRKDQIPGADLRAAFHVWAAEAGQPPMAERSLALRFKAISQTWACPASGRRFTYHCTGRFNGYLGLVLI